MRLPSRRQCTGVRTQLQSSLNAARPLTASALRAAGALYVHDHSNLTVLDSAFANNVGSDGGAITVWNSSLLVNGTAFTNNSAGGTGAPGAG